MSDAKEPGLHCTVHSLCFTFYNTRNLILSMSVAWKTATLQFFWASLKFQTRFLDDISS